MKYYISVFFLIMTTTGSAAANDKLTVLLDWFINPDHGPLILAEELGYFDEAGLTIELVEPADPSLPPRLVAAGKADIAVTYQPQLHVQIDEGLPLTRIATLVSTPLNSLVVLKDGPVEKIADLKGRKVGFSVGGFEDALLGTMLETHGLKLDDVELVNVNFSLSPSLITGQVDAVIGAFRNFELNQLDIEGHAGVAYFPEEHGVPAYDELIMVANNESLAAPSLRTFLRVLERATVYMINHPERSWELFRDSNPELLDNELNRRAWTDTLPRIALRPSALDVQRYETFAAFMQQKNLIEKTPPVDTYAVQLR
ncbi:MAG: ABC transporter substrate-binding protein [Granulosicoccus sp.]